MKTVLQFLAAAICCGAVAGHAGEWTGIRVYVGDTRLAWSGESDCGPCNRFCADLRAYNRGAKAAGGKGWRIGYAEVGTDGAPNQIVILAAMPDEATPYFCSVKNGIQGERIEGYDPDSGKTIDAILRLHPAGTKPVGLMRPARSSLTDEEPPRPRLLMQRTAPVYVVRQSQADGYQPHWTWPGQIKRHLAKSHGYSMAWLDTLSPDQLERLHDGDHDSGRVTPYGVQRWPVQASRPMPMPRPSIQTAGVQVFGAPLIGTYRSACPGGQCPR